MTIIEALLITVVLLLLALVGLVIRLHGMAVDYLESIGEMIGELIKVSKSR